uniref:Uncharacterized protein n=1 Tax=Oryza punctata TaxID=4537 RepID=A0A0E0JY34_ORYPU
MCFLAGHNGELISISHCTNLLCSSLVISEFCENSTSEHFLTITYFMKQSHFSKSLTKILFGEDDSMGNTKFCILNFFEIEKKDMSHVLGGTLEGELLCEGDSW